MAQNCFSYFTEIEARFQQRRGSILMLSTLDWALIETWREAGVPLEAVLRGIDAAFDKHEAQRARLGTRRQRKVNGLAWCAQAVLESTEQAKDAAIGAVGEDSAGTRESGFEAGRIARYLARNAAELEEAAGRLVVPAGAVAAEAAARHRELAAGLDAQSLEDVDRVLTVLEEKLFAALTTATPEPELTALRMHADRELAPYRGKMQAVQIKQVQQQFLHKRLLEMHRLPRLSLFYMPHDDE
jgi:phage terminase Nu1 subunit (DNA packaging protein)